MVLQDSALSGDRIEIERERDRERERERITTYFPQGACYGMDSHVPPIAGCTGGVGDSDTAE